MATTEFLVVYHCEFTFYKISKKDIGLLRLIIVSLMIQMVNRPSTTPSGQDKKTLTFNTLL